MPITSAKVRYDSLPTFNAPLEHAQVLAVYFSTYNLPNAGVLVYGYRLYSFFSVCTLIYISNVCSSLYSKAYIII